MINFSNLTKRIIPCLDIKNGRTVKGVNFLNIRDAGDPVELAQQYALEGADELVLLDITVGGGISSIADASRLLEAGADKVSINSSAVKRPGLVDDLAREFGSQFVVVAIDTREMPALPGSPDPNTDNYQEMSSDSQFTTPNSPFTTHVVHTHGGSRPTDLQTVAWSIEVFNRGAGEILLTSMNTDGAKNGFALNITKQVVDAINIPVIASGGAGKMEHFKEVFEQSGADAGLAASIFHFGEIPVPVLKKYLREQHISVRI